MLDHALTLNRTLPAHGSPRVHGEARLSRLPVDGRLIPTTRLGSGLYIEAHRATNGTVYLSGYGKSIDKLVMSKLSGRHIPEVVRLTDTLYASPEYLLRTPYGCTIADSIRQVFRDTCGQGFPSRLDVPRCLFKLRHRFPTIARALVGIAKEYRKLGACPAMDLHDGNHAMDSRTGEFILLDPFVS